MSVVPVTFDFTFAENATWAFTLRFCTGARDVVYDPGGGLLTCVKPHGLIAGDRVVLVVRSGDALPEGFVENQPYFVLADGLTSLSLKLSLTAGGAAIAPAGSGDAEIVMAKVVDITDDTIDCDVATVIESVESQVATFDVTKTDPVTGLAMFRIAPSITASIEAGQYRYDVSRTTPDGDRYYYQRGVITVVDTISRNT